MLNRDCLALVFDELDVKDLMEVKIIILLYYLPLKSLFYTGFGVNIIM